MLKKSSFILLFCFCLFSMYSVNAQVIKTEESELIYVNPEIAPHYIGGMDAFYIFFRKKFVMQSNFHGSNAAIATFVVEKDGSLSDIKILNDLGKKTTKELIRVLKLSPKWSPGKINGVTIRTSYRIPINITKY